MVRNRLCIRVMVHGKNMVRLMGRVRVKIKVTLRVRIRWPRMLFLEIDLGLHLRQEDLGSYRPS